MNDGMEFEVLGRPQPQGSIRAFMVGGKPRLTSDNAKMKPWRQQVGQMALSTRPTESVWAGEHIPVCVRYEFYFAKPKSAKKSRTLPCVKPDIDKICRATNDALTGIIWHDDAQIVELTAMKQYGLPERTVIRVWKDEQ